jgi:hypothetical protein
MVVVTAMDGVAEVAGEIDAGFGADEARGTGDEESFGYRGRRNGSGVRSGVCSEKFSYLQYFPT